MMTLDDVKKVVVPVIGIVSTVLGTAYKLGSDQGTANEKQLQAIQFVAVDVEQIRKEQISNILRFERIENKLNMRGSNYERENK